MGLNGGYDKWEGNRLKLAKDWWLNNFHGEQHTVLDIAEIMVSYNKEMKSILNSIAYFDFDVPNEEPISVEDIVEGKI